MTFQRVWKTHKHSHWQTHIYTFSIALILLPALVKLTNYTQIFAKMHSYLPLFVSVCIRIIDMLSPIDMALFRERIRFIDEKIQPGLTRFLWSSKASDIFIRDCLPHVDKVETEFSAYWYWHMYSFIFTILKFFLCFVFQLTFDIQSAAVAYRLGECRVV